MSNPKPGYTTGGAGRGGAAHSGGAGGAGRSQYGAPRRQPSILPLRVSYATALDAPRRHEKYKSLSPPIRGTQRIVDERIISLAVATLRFRLLTSGTTPFLALQPFWIAPHKTFSPGCIPPNKNIQSATPRQGRSCAGIRALRRTPHKRPRRPARQPIRFHRTQDSNLAHP